jgi:hypothetical protein
VKVREEEKVHQWYISEAFGATTYGTGDVKVCFAAQNPKFIIAFFRQGKPYNG